MSVPVEIPKKWLNYEICRDKSGKVVYVVPVTTKRVVGTKVALDNGEEQFALFRVLSSKFVQEGLVGIIETVVESYNPNHRGYDDEDDSEFKGL